MSVQALTDRKVTCLDVVGVTNLAKKIISHSIEICNDEDGSIFRRYFDFVVPVGTVGNVTTLGSDISGWRNKATRLISTDVKYN